MTIWKVVKWGWWYDLIDLREVGCEYLRQIEVPQWRGLQLAVLVFMFMLLEQSLCRSRPDNTLKSVCSSRPMLKLKRIWSVRFLKITFSRIRLWVDTYHRFEHTHSHHLQGKIFYTIKVKAVVSSKPLLYISLITHSWSWALLEKLPIVQLLENFTAFYGTRRFVTAFTWALHRSLSWARSKNNIMLTFTAVKISGLVFMFSVYTEILNWIQLVAVLKRRALFSYKLLLTHVNYMPLISVYAYGSWSLTERLRIYMDIDVRLASLACGWCRGSPTKS
jgi:hypothetical protein